MPRPWRRPGRYPSLDGVAAAAGPGLIGGVIVGLTTAKAIALVQQKPLIAVNHLEAHALTARLTDGTPFPYCLFLASGGHTQILAVRGVGDYERCGSTKDDAMGEAFDKIAKLLGLGLPGGPEVEKLAAAATPTVSRCRDRCATKSGGFFLFRPEDRGAAGSQKCAPDAAGCRRPLRLVPAGGDRRGSRPRRSACVPRRIAPSRSGRRRWCRRQPGNRGGLLRRREVGARLVVPPNELCTDNGAMVAWAGGERLALGLTDTLDVAARARWPLDEIAAAKGKLQRTAAYK